MSGIFLDSYRGDDLFTRRSVLYLISSWVENKIFGEHQTDKKNILNLFVIEPILTNAVIDFDWETRLSCIHILLVIAQTHAEKSAEFFCSIFDFVVYKSLFDVEVKVQEKAMQCLHTFQHCLKDDLEATEKSKIFSMDEFKICLKKYQKNGEKWCVQTLRHFVSVFDFSRLIDSLKSMDDYVQNDVVSLMDDILSSSHQKDENLLIDCY